MNEYNTYLSATKFNPPHEGLISGESIVWTRRAGTGFWAVFGAFIVVIGGPALILVFLENLDTYGGPIVLPFSVLVVVGIIVIAASFIRTRRTRYYLTSERLLETRGGRVLKEIPLHHFAGKPIGQFFETRVTHRTNDRPIYQIRIYDPMSDEVFEINGQDESSTRAFERIGDVLECPYCHFDNTALSSLCKNCDAVL